jgi:hypothetical protein
VTFPLCSYGVKLDDCDLALQIWYGSGPGSPTSAAVGIGYVQELVSRLTKTRIREFHSSVNESIVSNETLFPLDQPLYVDATHDTVMSASESFSPL